MSRSALEELRATQGPCALLESTTSGTPHARHTLLARHPRAWARGWRAGLELADERGSRFLSGSPPELLRELLAARPAGTWPDEPAWVGALAYEWARPQTPLEPERPLWIALLVDRLELFPAATAAPRAVEDQPPGLDLARASNFTPQRYREGVLQAQKHIARGDIYQANLSQRFEFALPEGRNGLQLYAELRSISPAPFSGYLRAFGLELVSASPERLVEVSGDCASTRPIAGTRPRSADPREDARLGRELLLSEKERAEHLMLVDLARNDLGQIARLGSVEVDELMAVEHYAQVRHIVSNVRALLARDRDAVDALLALFPGGTITGVPKRRCLEILDRLERGPRGFYTGALFYLSRSGRLDANILIRSAEVRGQLVSFSAGAGIVADSDPEREYLETLHKARGLAHALARLGAVPASSTTPTS